MGVCRLLDFPQIRAKYDSNLQYIKDAPVLRQSATPQAEIDLIMIDRKK
jgi:hypothetical protein